MFAPRLGGGKKWNRAWTVSWKTFSYEEFNILAKWWFPYTPQLPSCIRRRENRRMGKRSPSVRGTMNVPGFILLPRFPQTKHVENVCIGLQRFIALTSWHSALRALVSSIRGLRPLIIPRCWPAANIWSLFGPLSHSGPFCLRARL